jgi:hypothetical protein
VSLTATQEPRDRPSLDGAHLRHDRAKEHIGQVASEIAVYVSNFNSAPKQMYVKPGSGFSIDMGPLAEAPFQLPGPMLSVYLGEAIYNLRAALDYLVYELAWLDSGEIQKQTQFPIESSAEQFKGRQTGHYIERKSGKQPKKRSCTITLAGVNSLHLGWLERYQPYKRCKWTKLLNALSNPDKHRELTQFEPLVTAEARYAGPPVETDTGTMQPVEYKYTPFIGINKVPMDAALRVLDQEVGNVLALFDPEFES